MKIVKSLVVIILLLVAIPLVAAVFVRKTYRVEKEITIAAKKWDVYRYVIYLKNQDNFSKWATMDPNMEKYFKGNDGEIGFISGWKSKNENVGEGEQEIVGIQAGSRIDYALRFTKPFESTSDAYFKFESIDTENTKVTWGITGQMPYPMNLMLLVTDMTDEIGEDLDFGLNKLQALMEKSELVK